MEGRIAECAKPVRPAVTPLFACGSAFWAACAFAYTCARQWEGGACAMVAMGVVAACPIAAAVCLKHGKRAAAGLVAAALVGVAAGLSGAAACHMGADAASRAGFSDVEIRLAGDTKATSSGEGAFASVKLDGEHAVRVYVDFPDGSAHLNGDTLRVSGSFRALRPETDEYLWQNGAVGRLNAASFELVADDGFLAPLRAVRKRAIEAFATGDDAGALLQALVCGYRHDITGTALYARFQACGLAHLVAVSGAHLVIVTSMLASALRCLRVPRRVSIAVLIAMMAAYLVVSGVPVSAVRATIMSSIGLLALLGRRRPSAMNALGLGMFAIVGMSPPASVSASFALSALSTAGIVVFAPLVEWWLSDTALARVPLVAQPLALTLSANVLSQPFACSLFHQLPVVGPLANIVTAPLFPLACGAGLVAALASSAPASMAVAASLVAGKLSALLAVLVEALSTIPLASVPIDVQTLPALAFSLVAAFALWATWPRLRVRCVVPAALAFALLASCYCFALGCEDAIVMLDVGQGDSFLVKSRGETLLVDTGNRDSQLLGQLARAGALRLGSVLVTHSDDDHCGSLDALEKAVDVDRVLVCRGLLESGSEKNREVADRARRTARDVEELSAGDSFRIGAFTATVVWPHAFAEDGGNADSLCLLLEYDGDDDGARDFSALFTGDAEKEQLAEILESGEVGAIDVLKVAHHGSKNAMTESQAALLHPSIALIGVGEGNRYGHPAPETVAMLESNGCRVYRSDRDGQVKCSFAPDSIAVGLQ